MATILVVDDMDINRQLLIAMLECDHHQLLEAANGAEALTVIKKTKPDLIITDILMPKMDGCTLAVQLQADSELAKIPIIFYTATYNIDEGGKLAESCGVKYVLLKPSNPQKLLAVVNQALESIKQKSKGH